MYVQPCWQLRMILPVSAICFALLKRKRELIFFWGGCLPSVRKALPVMASFSCFTSVAHIVLKWPWAVDRMSAFSHLLTWLIGLFFLIFRIRCQRLTSCASVTRRLKSPWKDHSESLICVACCAWPTSGWLTTMAALCRTLLLWPRSVVWK